ncbi:KR domain-containing protein [Streptomyces sp. NPDC001536]|uniref:KR domain-containing protein n=1 Tax=Streptomyces sp. NPDC001536 TaxID=3364583 RepID=UPI00369CDF7D
MDASMSAMHRPPHGGASDTPRHHAVWTPAATHPRTPPVFPVQRMLLAIDGRDNGRAWVPGSVRTVRVGRDVTGSAMSWSTYLGELRDAGRRPHGIVVDLPAATTSVERAADLALPLLRALCTSTGPDPLRLAFLVTGRARPELAAALGAVAQIAAVEDGRLNAVSLRVETPPAWARDPFHVARAELALPRPGLAEVRYTDTGREVRVLRTHPAPGAPAPRVGLRRGGRYLVGGGGDGGGERLAGRLVRELGARVVLFGGGGDAGLGDGALVRVPGQSPYGARAGRGGGVLVRVPGRPAQYADVRGAVQAALREFGGLDGVVHCPGGGQARLLGGQSVGAARETVADAVSGAAHLDRATAGLPLEFFALAVDADPYQALAGAAVPAAVARAFGSIAAARARLAAAGARHGASYAVCGPGDLAGLLSRGRGTWSGPAPRAA